MDEKKIPENVDLAIIEGGVRTAHDEEKVKEVRDKSKTIIALAAGRNSMEKGGGIGQSRFRKK